MVRSGWALQVRIGEDQVIGTSSAMLLEKQFSVES